MINQFRWLHLSDVHYISNSNQSNLNNELLQKIKQVTESTPVDCIIITGDFFSQGIPDASLKSFLSDLYNICSDTGKWNVTTENPMERLFVCPGNHDLNRNAANRYEGYYRYRPDVLRELTASDPDEFIAPASKYQYDLMTKHAFWEYNQLAEKLNRSIKQNKFKYECNIFQVNGSCTLNPVVFVGINTELYAGQVRPTVEIKHDAAAKFSEFLTLQKEYDFQQAIEAYKQYCSFYQELIDGNVARDEKKLCFISASAQQYTSDIIKNINPPPIVIIFGHRSIESFTEEAQRKEALFANNCNRSQIYLCGHSHRPGYTEVKTIFEGTNPYTQYQICVGGSFVDSYGYNTCSFSIGTITWKNEEKPELTGTLYIWKELFDSNNVDGVTVKPFHWVKCPFSRKIVLDFGGGANTIRGDRSKNTINVIQKKDEFEKSIFIDNKLTSTEEPYNEDSTIRGPRYPKIGFDDF